MPRAQVTIEFMFVIGAILLIFLIIVSFTFEKRIDLREKEAFINKRTECLRISDLISSIFAAGPGAQADLKTDYLITVFNNTLMMVEDIGNITQVEAKIAVLASEAGETKQSFYEQVTSTLSPDWYRTCFSDIYWSCPGWISDNIKWDIEDLMQNISVYNTIYLEDSHIQYNAQTGGKLYIDILSDWVSAGNALIIAEHFMCREESYGSYPSTSYRCNPPDYKSDVWNIFGQALHQRGGSYGNDITVVKEENGFNFDIGDTFDFEEDSYIDETASTSVIARYDDNQKPAILYWKYGKGKIFYFGDFQVHLDEQDEYTGVIASLIEKAYSLVTPVEESEVLCSFYAKSPYQKLTGDLTIKNIDNQVIITNATST